MERERVRVKDMDNAELITLPFIPSNQGRENKLIFAQSLIPLVNSPERGWGTQSGALASSGETGG